MPSYATFCLGSRQDAVTWGRGCARLGYAEGHVTRRGRVPMSDVRAFFGDCYEWIYIGGHYSGGELYDESHASSFRFSETSVEVSTNGETATLEKDNGFQLHRKCKVVLWGGCSLLGYEREVKKMRKLFGPNHVMLGFGGITGWRIVDALLGNGFIQSKNAFFGRLSTSHTRLDEVVKAWMETAKLGYAGGELEDLFRAVDTTGKIYKLSGGAIVEDR